jgi:Mg2+ and Co2+ transporter CorA
VKWKIARVKAASETLQASYQNYLAYVSVQAAYIQNNQNSVLKKITMLLAITSPLNLIASVFGMNVYPLSEVTVVSHENQSNILFITLLIIMFVSSFVLLFTAKRYKWL